jgi:hypothetical protein
MSILAQIKYGNITTKQVQEWRTGVIAYRKIIASNIRSDRQLLRIELHKLSLEYLDCKVPVLKLFKALNKEKLAKMRRRARAAQNTAPNCRRIEALVQYAHNSHRYSKSTWSSISTEYYSACGYDDAQCESRLHAAQDGACAWLVAYTLKTKGRAL